MAEGHGRLASARLRALRLDAGLTQRELADMARVSIGFVRDLEQGRFRRPNLERVRQLADVLDIDTTQRQGMPEDSGQVAAERNGWAAGPEPFPGGVTGPRIGILGPLVVFHDGEAGSDLSGAPAALLGLLALSANSTVSRPAIVDALWGEEPPRSAVGIVHTYISRLRSVLGTGGEEVGGLLVRDRGGYRLNLDQDQLDVLHFRRLVESARQLRAAGDAVQAGGTYERALDLWRGEPLADIDILRGYPAVVALTRCWRLRAGKRRRCGSTRT